MSYNKRVWANGDLITKEGMNNIENGIYDAHDKINAIDNELSSQIKDIKKNNVSISVKEYGAKGDGVTDDTIAIKECWDYCTENALTMFFPNGTYILNEQLKKTDDITSSDAEKPIYMIGESAFGVKINTTNEIKPVIDVSRSKTVYMSNIASDNTWFKCVQYGDNFRSFSRLRDIQLYNVFSLDRTHSYPSWNMFINTPSPFNYNNEEVDSFYNRYPIEIVSNSGYNPIMINNFANTNDDGSNGYPSDNSSIGIVDEVSNASGAILINGGKRSFLQGQNRSTDSNVYKSAVRNNVVYEVNGQGHIAIGCSTVNNDTVAPDNATIKARDTYPKVILYDTNRANRKTVLGSSDDLSYIRCYKNDNSDYIALNINQSDNAFRVYKGHFSTGDILELNDSTYKKVPGIRGYSTIKITASSVATKWLDGIDCNVIGREITLYTSVSNFVLKQGTFSTSFRNKSKTDLTMEVGVAYRYIRLDDGWYQI